MTNGEPAAETPYITDVYPLTPMQNGILFHTLQVDHAGPYIEQFLFEVSAPLDLGRFARAWRVVLDRHPALRTAFVWAGVDEPVQVVVAGRDIPLSEVDTRGWSTDGFDRELAGWLTTDRERGFRLAEAPLMRLSLLPRPTGGAVLVWTLHHLLMDGWSMPITVHEVAAVYRALGTGAAPQLPAARPFRDFVAWLRREQPAGAEGFWRDRLDGMSRTPISAPPPEQEQAGTAADGRAYHDLGPDLSRSLAAVAHTARVTLSTVYQAGWALLLARLAGSTDVVFGTTVSGRPADLEGVEHMVGVFINTVPHRIQISGDRPVRDWLVEVQRRHLDTEPYQHLGLGRIQGWSPVPAGESMFDSIVVFENYPSENPSFDLGDGLTLAIKEIIEDAGYPLTLTVLPRQPSTRLQLLYDPKRYSDDAARRLLAGYTAGLSELAESVESNLTGLRIPTEASGVSPATKPATVPTAEAADDFFAGSPSAEVMRVLWSEVLGREVTDPDGDFFRLGGDSLAAVRLVGRLAGILPSQVPVSALFQDRTLRRLLERVHRQLGGAEAADRLAAASND